MPIPSDQFAFLRLSNPAAAFDVLFKEFYRAVEDDGDMAGAFAAFQKGAGRKFKFSMDVRRIDALKAQGADKLGINVGSMSTSVSAGLVFMYDVAVEALRTSDVRLKPQMISSRAIRTADRLFDIFLSQAGSMSVTALDLALRDESYAQRLRQRAGELTKVAKLEGVSFLNQPPDPTLCEHCVVTVEDKDGNIIDFTCPTEEECRTLGTTILILLLIWLTYKLLDWLF